MIWRHIPGHLPRRGSGTPCPKARQAVLVVATLLLAVFLALNAACDIKHNVDESIPPAQALKELTELLRNLYQIKLDSTVKVLAAHDEHGGLQGDGTKWFLVRLAPGEGRRFEAEFLDQVKAAPRLGPPVPVIPVAIGAIEEAVVQPLGWRTGPPPDAHAWKLDDRNSTFAIFFDDAFYFHWDHF